MSTKTTKSRQIKENRRKHIIDTTFKLYISEGYNALTIARIAEEADLYRNAVYKLYKTPADILLDYIGCWLDLQTKQLLVKEEHDISPIYKIVGIIDLDHELKKLAAIYASVLEPAASYEHLVRFRKKMKRFSEILGIIAIEYDPLLTPAAYQDYYQSFLILFIGTVSLYTYDMKIIKACEKLNEVYLEFGICELAIDFFSGTPGIEEAIGYWQEVSEIVNAKKYKPAETITINNELLFGDYNGI